MQMVRRILKYFREKPSNEESNAAPTYNTARIFPQIYASTSALQRTPQTCGVTKTPSKDKAIMPMT
jgi:hypothetical protein